MTANDHVSLWGGRFSGAPADALSALSVSTHFDWRLAGADIAGSHAHADALHAVGLLSDDEARAGLGAILVNSTGNIVDSSGNGQDRDWLVPVAQLAAPEQVFGICGGACAIRRDAWEEVGGIRTDLFMYYEDTDLSYKLREAGYDVRFVRQAVVDHEHAASSDATSPMFARVNARNRLIVAAEHASWQVIASALVRSVVRAARAGFRGPAARGVAQGIAAIPGALRRRHARNSRRAGAHLR